MFRQFWLVIVLAVLALFTSDPATLSGCARGQVSGVMKLRVRQRQVILTARQYRPGRYYYRSTLMGACGV